MPKTIVKEAERDIVKAILHYLAIRGYVCKRNNAGGAMVTNKYGNSHWINIGEAGWPDIEGIAKDGKYFGIEVKTKKGILSDSQKLVGERILAMGGLWFVARSVDEVISRGF